MKAKKILLYNSTTSVLHVQAFVEDGTFLIILFRQLPLGRCKSIPQGATASYQINEAIRECLSVAQRLNYDVQNRAGERLFSEAHPDKRLEAIVITITTEGN